MAECDHDWRVDPHAPLRASNPPQVRLVCAECLQERWWFTDVPTDDPATWPPATGSV